MTKRKYLERIRGMREDSDKSQREVAEYLNIAQTTYSQYELGKREIPIDCIIKLCKLYHVSADYILGLSDKK